MRHEDDEDDEVASVASAETRGTFMSDDGEFYDGYSKNEDDEQDVDDAVEELTEKRCLERKKKMQQSMDGRMLISALVTCVFVAQNDDAGCRA